MDPKNMKLSLKKPKIIDPLKIENNFIFKLNKKKIVYE